MTATSVRSCVTCQFYKKEENACSGECAHPSRKSPYDVHLFVRQHELGCRIDWETDLWEPKEQRIVVTGLCVWEAIPGDATPDELPVDLLALLSSIAAD